MIENYLGNNIKYIESAKIVYFFDNLNYVMHYEIRPTIEFRSCGRIWSAIC